MSTPTKSHTHRIYDGDADSLMTGMETLDQILLLPDAANLKAPLKGHAIRIMWGQHMLEDLTQDRYRTLVCAVNAHDNSHGIISQLAKLLPTSQWHDESITAYAKQFAMNKRVSVLKYDMDALEVLAILRPTEQDHLTLANLREGFEMVTEMIRRKPQRLPSASVSFLGARANKLQEAGGGEPSFETVLRTMHDAGYMGDVYPAVHMWETTPPVFARYPFPESIQRMREGGF
ncbi:MAG: hypothetical protein WD768_23075 [Phycisphaeraceae bacterium]